MTNKLIRVEGEVAYVTLTKGYETIIDASDVALVSWWKWRACVTPRNVYAITTVRKETLKLHRILMQAPKGLEVDHINGNGLDNRRVNLRLCTKTQNQYNTGAHRDSVSGLKGVTRSGHSKWKAQIKHGGRTKYLGSFDTPQEAQEAYLVAAKRLHGDFAPTTSPTGVE